MGFLLSFYRLGTVFSGYYIFHPHAPFLDLAMDGSKAEMDRPIGGRQWDCVHQPKERNQTKAGRVDPENCAADDNNTRTKEKNKLRCGPLDSIPVMASSSLSHRFIIFSLFCCWPIGRPPVYLSVLCIFKVSFDSDAFFQSLSALFAYSLSLSVSLSLSLSFIYQIIIIIERLFI